MPETTQIALIALFITALVTAQVLAVKILALPLPTSIPLLGSAIIVPAGVLAYAVTFFASDCYTELFGRRSAHVMVNVGFAMNLVLLALVWLAIASPGSNAGVDPGAFARVLGVSANIVIASLGAYLVSQNWDVFAFHTLGTYTRGRHLWARNIGSTLSSQFVDTVIFILLAFLFVPSITSIGFVLPPTDLVQLIAGQYFLKLIIALVDTPFVYLVVGYVSSHSARATPSTSN